MTSMPEFKKARRELTGHLALTFLNKDNNQEFTKAFTELRAGISWPIRSVPGYLCVLGLYYGTKFGVENSLMLVYEKHYPNAVDLMTDAYNRAAEMRFQRFYTDRQHPHWRGFDFEFNRQIRVRLGNRDTRLLHSPFASDFIMGKDVIRRLAGAKAIEMPGSVLRDQLRDMTAADLEKEHPEYKFYAINGFRFLLVAWDMQVNNSAGRMFGDAEQEIPVAGWA
jgi:hypothetical protein